MFVMSLNIYICNLDSSVKFIKLKWKAFHLKSFRWWEGQKGEKTNEVEMWEKGGKGMARVKEDRNDCRTDRWKEWGGNMGGSWEGDKDTEG
jgi:hypothetical protein